MDGWFACPQCGREIDERDGALVCPSGHRFELGRRGYAALVVGRSPLVRSAPAAALDAVDAEWESGVMDGVGAAVEAMLPPASAVRVLDVGGDLGHLLAGLERRRLGMRALVLGSSPSALGRATARAGAHGVLVDPSRPWPVRDGVADVVLCAFADHRPAEFHRVLAPGGSVVVAGTDDEARGIEDDLYPWFEHDQTRTTRGPGGSLAVIRFRRRRRPLTW